MFTGMTNEEALISSWLNLWNGDYALAEKIIQADFRLHAAMLGGGDGSAVNTPAALVDWIAMSRTVIPDLVFTIEVGPLADGDHIALRWHAVGTYAGGMPGAGAPAGTPVDFTGTDLLRTEHGRLAEYWLNSDTLQLVTQLQVTAS
jgi:predicted ester cyclase